jgi:cleavage and polyadenylation specificity factor subunit 3
MGAIDVKLTQEHELTLEWDSSSSNDMIADSTLALITSIDRSPASVKCETSLHIKQETANVLMGDSNNTTFTFPLPLSSPR